MENLLLILQRAISEEKKKSSFSLQSLLYIRVHSEISVVIHCLDLVTDISSSNEGEDTRDSFCRLLVNHSTSAAFLFLLLLWDTWYPTAQTQIGNWPGNVICVFLPAMQGKKKKSGMHLTGAFEHAQKICAILCFCYLGFSKIRDVTRCRC